VRLVRSTQTRAEEADACICCCPEYSQGRAVHWMEWVSLREHDSSVTRWPRALPRTPNLHRGRLGEPQMPRTTTDWLRIPGTASPAYVKTPRIRGNRLALRNLPQHGRIARNLGAIRDQNTQTDAVECIQVGYPKETPLALAEHVEKNNLQGQLRFSLFGTSPRSLFRWRDTKTHETMASSQSAPRRVRKLRNGGRGTK
jgi:hypothetical protein